MIIRDASVGDMDRVCSIYNALIPTTTIAWTEDLQSIDARIAWFEKRIAGGHVVLVAEDDGEAVAFASYGDFRGAGVWSGYRYTVEHTIHVTRAYWSRGVGRLLLSTLIERAQANGIHSMIGAIDSDNVDSIQFHERLGFTVTARLPEVGTKFGRWLDLVLMQRTLDAREPDDR